MNDIFEELLHASWSPVGLTNDYFFKSVIVRPTNHHMMHTGIQIHNTGASINIDYTTICDVTFFGILRKYEETYYRIYPNCIFDLELTKQRVDIFLEKLNKMKVFI